MNKNLLKFLSTENVVEIKDEMEFAQFSGILDKYNLLWILSPKNIDSASINSLRGQRVINYYYWLHLVEINSKTGDKDLVFEYDVEKGITFYTNRQNAIDWYGIEPLTVDDLE